MFGMAYSITSRLTFAGLVPTLFLRRNWSATRFNCCWWNSEFTNLEAAHNGIERDAFAFCFFRVVAFDDGVDAETNKDAIDD